ncbi:MAG: hypothetical protein KDI82_03550 [Gammaproteobacteria bacterium]|nr:hypothetical protein [Gammaproteobacteria bacterium]
MATIEQWGVPLAVLGMLLALLFMASVVKRYQAHQAVVRSAIQRLEQGLADLLGSLDILRPVPLSRELRVLLRGDVLARLQRIARLYRRYPGIEARITDAEAALAAEAAPSGNGVGPIDDERSFRQMLNALDELQGMISSGSLLQPVPRDVREIFRRELGERRAEVNARFHLVQSMQYKRSGDRTRARGHVTTLMQVLRSRGPSTDFVRELYVEAESALQALTAHVEPDEKVATDSGSGKKAAGGNMT